jgi:hypothetical protein
MTVRELLTRMDSLEFSEWMAYYGIEPFGQERDNLHAGIVAKAIYDVNQDPKKRRDISPADFIAREKEPVDPKELYDRFRAWAGLNQKQ